MRFDGGVQFQSGDPSGSFTALGEIWGFAKGKAIVGPPKEVITTETLSALYGAPVEVLRASDGRLVVVGTPEAPAHHTDRHEG